MLDAAELDLVISAGCEVTAKDSTANERQRRHRERLRDRHGATERDGHGQKNVTVTTKPTSEVDGHHQERGSPITG
jgi:hypothetical protein